MHYFTLTADVKELIVSHINPRCFTPSEVKLCARIVKVLHGRSARLPVLKRIYELALNYSKYNNHVEHPDLFWNRTRLCPKTPFSQNIRSLFQKSPQLFAAISTGHWLFDSNYKQNRYTPELEQDIKDIIDRIPESLNFIFGDSKIHACILTPLSLACLNDKIPLHIIELLIVKGASLKVPCKATSQMVPLNSHLGWGSMNSKRLAAILKIFEKYQ